MPEECRGIPGERNRVGAMCQGNAGECQGNVWKLVQSAGGMQENAMGYKGVGAMGQLNAGECRGIPGDCMGEGAKCQGNAGECQGNVLELVQSAM